MAQHSEGERTADLGFARVDVDRARRTGDPEVVYGAGKTAEQVVDILRTLHGRHPERAVLATRLNSSALGLVSAELPEASIDPVARAVTLGPMPPARGTVAIIAAGTSDAPVAAEAALTVRVHGSEAVRIDDV
ncbi:MAG: 1-(5-phosphoribosyl)-5-amino-4-imidazole-carboxylate carboxylase, partial [Marmoricola sp.]